MAKRINLEDLLEDLREARNHVSAMEIDLRDQKCEEHWAAEGIAENISRLADTLKSRYGTKT
jgi:hypothetical protein